MKIFMNNFRIIVKYNPKVASSQLFLSDNDFKQ